MDYQLLFEIGELTPQQLLEWMKTDPASAGKALKQRPEYLPGLREAMSLESTDPTAAQNQPQSAYSQMRQKSDDLYGAEEDDGFVEGVGKGFLDVPAGTARIGGAIADYGKAGFNELTGNEEGLQWEDTPDLQDVGYDAFNTGLAALTGGGGPSVLRETGKKTLQNLSNQGLKNTLGKIKDKALNSDTGKLLFGGPKRKMATGLGGVGLLNSLGNSAEEETPDIVNTAPGSIASTPPQQVNLENPTPMPMPMPASGGSDEKDLRGQLEMAIANNVDADPKDKSLTGFGKKIYKQSMVNSANQKLREAKKKDLSDAKISGIADRKEAFMRESWNNSPYGYAATGLEFDELDPITQANMRKRFMDSVQRNAGSSADIASKDRRQAFADSGSFYADPNDPDNKNQAPGQVSKAEFDKETNSKAGMGLTQNPDGTFNTLEFGDAFDRAGGQESANDILNMPQQAALSRQLRSEDDIFTDAYGQQIPKTKSTVRMSGNMQDYGDVGFKSKEDALAYLNRPSLEQPAQPETVEEDEGLDFKDYAIGAGTLGLGALLSRTPFGKRLIQNGITRFRPMKQAAPLKPMQGPAAPQYLSNPYRSTRNMKPEYRGGTPAAPRPTLDAPTNPMSSTSSMRKPARTPQDVGIDDAISAMDRQSLIRAAGGARNASGKMATDEELRRLARLKAQGLL